MRPLRLFWAFFRIGAMNELQYRANFVIQVVQSGVALGTGLAVLALVFSQVTSLNGWSQPELLAVMGVHVLMGGIIGTIIQPNMQRLIDDVRLGTLDYVLTKPDDAQVLSSVRDVKIWHAVDVVIGLIVLGFASNQLESAVTPVAVPAFVIALLLGAVMIYCFWLILTIAAFWVVRMDEIVDLFAGVYQSGRWPVTIYPDWLRAGLTFLVPIAFAVTVPAQALTARLTPETLAGAAAFAVFLLVLTRVLWRTGLRRYAGASA